ncbi:MAG: hypothetical protein Q4F79_04485 [Eubacteriales bacterium]|nr:hypothetical protein [Eubacteriales bacterium]
MSRKKKNDRKKNSSTEYILLAVAILNLIETLMELIKTLIE